jgi:hypothetical protein
MSKIDAQGKTCQMAHDLCSLFLDNRKMPKDKINVYNQHGR